LLGRALLEEQEMEEQEWVTCGRSVLPDAKIGCETNHEPV